MQRLNSSSVTTNEYLSGERLFDSPSLEKARKEIISGHDKHLETLAEPLRNSGLVVKTTAVWDITPFTKGSSGMRRLSAPMLF